MRAYLVEFCSGVESALVSSACACVVAGPCTLTVPFFNCHEDEGTAVDVFDWRTVYSPVQGC